MHIIKITPVSFKIILSKEDLQRHGIDNILEKNDISGDFFAEIIDKTKALYGCPFTEGAIDAEFFESKDGGGELFLFSTKHFAKQKTILFRTEDCENLFFLCARLKSSGSTYDSRLYFDDGKYSLLIFCRGNGDNLLPILREYGNASEISKLQMWLLEEHSTLLCESCAIESMAQHFT